MNRIKQKKRQVYLSVFFVLHDSQSGALKDVAQQNPVVTATYCLSLKAAL